MASTGVTTGVPTSTVNVPPLGSGSSNGFVHNLFISGIGGCILKDSENKEIKLVKADHSDCSV
jgi:hypothetical protein